MFEERSGLGDIGSFHASKVFKAAAKVVTAPAKAVVSATQAVVKPAIAIAKQATVAPLDFAARFAKANIAQTLRTVGVKDAGNRAASYVAPLTMISSAVHSAQGTAPTQQKAPNPPDWMVYDYFNASGQLIDAYGNVSPSPATSGKVYYDAQGTPVDYMRRPVVADANGISLVQAGDKYYLLSDSRFSQEMMIGENGEALTLDQYRKKYQPDFGKYEYLDASGQLTDAYGNVSPSPATPGKVYYDVSGNPVDYIGNPVMSDAAGRILVQYQDRYFDLKSFQEVWVDDSGTAIAPEQWTGGAVQTDERPVNPAGSSNWQIYTTTNPDGTVTQVQAK